MAPQFEHSALTPPGTLLPFAPDGGRAAETLFTLAPGPKERVAALWVRTLSVGRDELEPGEVSLETPSVPVARHVGSHIGPADRE